MCLRNSIKPYFNSVIIMLLFASEACALRGSDGEHIPARSIRHRRNSTTRRPYGVDRNSVPWRFGSRIYWPPSVVSPPWIEVRDSASIPVDLIFLIDGSGSVNAHGPSNFDRIKQWIKSVAAEFDISNENVRIGVVQYSHWYRHLSLNNQRYIKTEVPLGGCIDRTCFNNLIDRISLMGFTTFTGAAITKTVQVDFASSSSETHKIIVLLTDGGSQDDVTAASNYARVNNVTIFSVGVGEYSLPELQMISNGETNNNWKIYQLSNFAELSSTVKDLQREIKAVYEISVCSPLIRPRHGTLTCTNANQIGSTCSLTCHRSSGFTVQGSNRRSCVMQPDVGPLWTGTAATCGVCSSSFDLLLIVDSSSSIGVRNFGIVKDFLTRLVDTFEIGENHVQVSAIRYHREVDDMWDYNTYHNRYNLLQAILNIPYVGYRTYTGRAINYALEKKFTQESGRRPNYPHITLVLTDGKASDSIRTPSEKLHSVSRVISIGVGSADPLQIDEIASDPDDLYANTIVGSSVELFDQLSVMAKKLCNAQESVLNKSCSMRELPNPSDCFALSCTNGNKAGSECRATCCSGSEIKNDATAFCTYDGTWSQTAWTCEEMPCQEIELTPGLGIECSNGSRVGSTCTMYCGDGYAIVERSTDYNCETSSTDTYQGCANRCLQSQSSSARIPSWQYPSIECAEITECLFQSCNNGYCTSDANGFTCTCHDGYSGTLCDINIDECASNPCTDGELCIDGINSFSCIADSVRFCR